MEGASIKVLHDKHSLFKPNETPGSKAAVSNFEKNITHIVDD